MSQLLQVLSTKSLASQLHSHYTRNCNLYYIPPCRTNIRNFSIRFQGPKFFNSVSPEIQNGESIRLFDKRLKKFLLSQSNILFVELHTSSFLFFSLFIFKIIHFNISCCPHNLYDVPYIFRKPIVHKPQASIQASLPLPPLRTFARKCSNINFCLKFLPLKGDELVMSEM